MLVLGYECHVVGTWVQTVGHRYHYNVKVDIPCTPMMAHVAHVQEKRSDIHNL